MFDFKVLKILNTKMFSSSPKGQPSQFGLVYRHESGSRNFFEEHFQEDNIEAGVVSHYYTFIDAALAQMNLYYNPVNDIPGTRAGEAQLLDKQYPGHDRYGNYHEHFLRGEDFKNLSSLRKEMNDYNQRMKKILSLYWESTGRFGRRERQLRRRYVDWILHMPTPMHNATSSWSAESRAIFSALLMLDITKENAWVCHYLTMNLSDLCKIVFTFLTKVRKLTLITLLLIGLYFS